MSIAAKISLAAAFAAVLAVTNAQAAVQGFSIALTDMTFERGSNLSAQAAAFGGQPAIELLNNGSYSETLTGDYAVSDTLPPSDQSVLWQTFTQISLNGNPFFTGNAIVGPESQNDIWSAILNITGLTPAQLAVLKAVLVNHNVLNTGGEFDYAYNLAPRRSHGRHFCCRLQQEPHLHRGLRRLCGSVCRLRLNLCSWRPKCLVADLLRHGRPPRSRQLGSCLWRGARVSS